MSAAAPPAKRPRSGVPFANGPDLFKGPNFPIASPAISAQRLRVKELESELKVARAEQAAAETTAREALERRNVEYLLSRFKPGDIEKTLTAADFILSGRLLDEHERGETLVLDLAKLSLMGLRGIARKALADGTFTAVKIENNQGEIPDYLHRDVAVWKVQKIELNLTARRDYPAMTTHEFKLIASVLTNTHVRHVKIGTNSTLAVDLSNKSQVPRRADNIESLAVDSPCTLQLLRTAPFTGEALKVLDIRIRDGDDVNKLPELIGKFKRLQTVNVVGCSAPIDAKPFVEKWFAMINASTTTSVRFSPTPPLFTSRYESETEAAKYIVNNLATRHMAATTEGSVAPSPPRNEP